MKSNLDDSNAVQNQQLQQPATSNIASTPPINTASDDNTAHTDALTLRFDAKRCIHARHCVMGEPKVFLANTPGKWLFPEKATPERIAIVANSCPSGAITYVRHDGQANEATPQVNVVRVRENGPLAIHAAIALEASDGSSANEIRLTLCRCGQSQNKPYCDGSHTTAAFIASGEPVTRPSDPLAVRNGILRVAPLLNGPLELSGAVEICAGTGRTIDRLTSTRLCRCGQSKDKPFCDNSHLAVGFIAPGV